MTGMKESVKAKRGPSARSKALDIVARRRSTASEVERKLKKAGYQGEEISDAVSYLVSLGYLNDAALAGDLAAGMLGTRGWGPAKVSASLMRRGIARTEAERAVSEASHSVNLVDGARAALKKRYGASAADGGDRVWARKAAGYLFRLGFSHDVSRAAIGALEED
jgi:SOS response regulatory protein OraA/RecX